MRSVAAGLLLCASLAGIAYTGLAVARSIAFGRRRRGRDGGATGYAPPVTILKPLCGDEPDLFENLSSFCDQDYADFQVVFGVSADADPAIETVRHVIERYPGRDLSLITGGRFHGSNHKISNVLNMFGHAKHDILIVADSDMRVGRDYLRAIVAAFADERVGAATCLYRGRMSSPTQTGRAQRMARLAQTLGVMFVDEQFAPSVLVATALSPMDFCLGATMAVTREALEAIGGFEALACHLADDQRLGRLVYESGRCVALCDEVVETTVSDRDLGTLWQHELRWARTMHAARPWGFSFSFITYALPLACAYLLVSGNAMAGVAVLSAALLARISLHHAARLALRADGDGSLWLIPLRDALGLAVWAAHFFGRDVSWRGAHYLVDASGRLHARSQRTSGRAGG